MKKKTFSGEKKIRKWFWSVFLKEKFERGLNEKKVGEKKRSKFAMGVFKKDLRKEKLGHFILRRKI